jgi:hypothetical protein
MAQPSYRGPQPEAEPSLAGLLNDILEMDDEENRQEGEGPVHTRAEREELSRRFLGHWAGAPVAPDPETDLPGDDAAG